MKEVCSNILRQEHLEMLYFFALKKTSNRQEAEDLAQDIATQALISLSNGSTPREFSPWLWAIARNRYAKWTAKQHKKAALISDKDHDYDLPDDSISVENIVIQKENIELLKRELSLLSSYYREITIAYYLNGEKISNIANKLHVPEGTIKRRLYESRKNLREGMKMARLKGQRSYVAENITFVKSGSDGTDASPWKLIQRLIPKNILMEAYHNPATLEELCVQMGIAMPYMEEEVKFLTEGTLLKEVEKGVFETDFIIVDHGMQTDIFNQLVNISEKVCPALLQFIDSKINEIRAITFINNDMESEELYWFLIPRIVDYVVTKVEHSKQFPTGYTKRPHNGSWDITGFEQCDFPFSTFVGHNGSGDATAILWSYKIGMNGLWDRAGELSGSQVLVLADAIRSCKQIQMLSEVEKTVIYHLMDRGFLTESTTEIKPTFVIMNSAQEKQLYEIVDCNDLQPLVVLFEELYDFAFERIGRFVPERLVNQLKFVTSEQLSRFRMMGLRYALDQERIILPEKIEKSTVAMHMVMY